MYELYTSTLIILINNIFMGFVSVIYEALPAWEHTPGETSRKNRIHTKWDK